MSIDKTTLGQRIRELRTQRGLSLRELARRIGVSPTYISHIETDTVSPAPTSSRLREIEIALQARADELHQLAGKVPEDVLQILINGGPVLWQALRAD